MTLLREAISHFLKMNDDTQWWLHYDAEDFYETNLIDKSVFVFSRLGGLLSSVAAVTIMSETYGDKAIVPSTLFAYQISILMHALAQVVGSWAIPKHTPARWGAMGDFTTCTVQGFFVLGGNISQLFFDLFLSLIYYLIVKRQTSEESLRKLQRYFFVFCVGVTAVATITPLFYEMYNPNWTTCGINSIPAGCQGEEECYRGAYSYLYMYFFMIIPIVAVLFSCFVMYRIYNHILEVTDLEEAARQVAIKGVMYSSTYVVSILPYIVAVIFNVAFGFWNRYYICFASTLLNMYGFFNLMVFLCGRAQAKTRLGWYMARMLGYKLAAPTNEREKSNFARNCESCDTGTLPSKT